MLHFVIDSTEDFNKEYDIDCEQILKDCIKIKSDSTESVTYTEFEKQVVQVIASRTISSTT